ncbi:MAG TPA: HAMP domain-containing sensor histidine kinase [Polyangiaceae bacterium]
MNDVRRASTPSAPAPRSAIATRVLASFAITVVAFAVTVGWSVVAQRRTAQDSEELAKGYVPVALKLGQLRATQAALATLVDGVPDERNPVSARLVLETLMSVRSVQIAETRSAITKGLAEVGTEEAQALATALLIDLDTTDQELADDSARFEPLFASLEAQDKDAVNRTLVTLGAREHDAVKHLRALSDRFAGSMNELSARSRAREQRAIIALIALAAMTLSVGVAVSIHTRRLLAPLAKVTERAQAVARGDLTAREVVDTGDEIGQLATAFERMVAGVARAQSRAVANERLAAIGKMAAHVTHEIRNPLSSIGLNIELLEEELTRASVPAEARALLQSITREVERLEHLSEEYLRVARLPSPRMEADDVAAAVEEIVAFARPEIERAGCSVAVEVQPQLPPALFDESQLRQALLNLLRNAREAMPDGGRIDVRVGAEAMSVFIDVADRGGGIPEDIRARVFDPFFSTKGEGTGLGLAITRQIVEAHGGAVTCDSREGGGTRFRLALPLAPPRASRAGLVTAY